MIYILCGYCLAGKSRLARALTAKFGVRHLDVDEILFARGYAGPDRGPNSCEWNECFGEYFARLEDSVWKGETVVCDGCNELRADRDHLKAIANRNGATAAIVWLDVSPSMARDRWKSIHTNPSRHVVSPDDFERVIRNFEPPTDESPLIRLRSDEHLGRVRGAVSP